MCGKANLPSTASLPYSAFQLTGKIILHGNHSIPTAADQLLIPFGVAATSPQGSATLGGEFAFRGDHHELVEADGCLTQIGLKEEYLGTSNPFPQMREIIDLKKEKNFFEPRVIEYQTGGALSWD